MNRRGFMGGGGSACGVARPLRARRDWSPAPKKTANELLRQALSERRVVQFKYHGHSRRVEPHALGRVTGSRPALLGWQVSGGSASEPPPGWRTFVLADIKSLKLMRPTFVPHARTTGRKRRSSSRSRRKWRATKRVEHRAVQSPSCCFTVPR
jgi:predicted DNA-binding transcriptional regulator YafY